MQSGTGTAASAGPGVATSPSQAVDSVLHAFMTIGRVMRQRIPGDDLEPGQLWLLKHLQGHGPMRITDLAGWANLDVSTVSRHISQMERAGLTDRTPDPLDGRAQRVQLSPDGADRLDRAFDRRRQLLASRLQSWEPDDVALLDDLLTRFVTTIDLSDPEHA